MARRVKNTAAQGARFENKVIGHLESLGYDCIRSAASKGAVDIVAVDSKSGPDWNDNLFIQCKLSNPNIGPAERSRLIGLAVRAGFLPIVASTGENESDARRRPIAFRELTGPGPKDWKPWQPAGAMDADDNESGESE